MIRTPDQRVRVFVSSTMHELAAERAAAVEAIRNLRLTPVLFELGARPHPPRELYRAYLQQSHVFVGVYGEQYGWVAPDMEISGLEDEYQLSEGHSKLIYVKEPAPNREERLKELLRRIERHNRACYKTFSTPEELGTVLANDLAVLLSERFETSREPGQAPAAPATEPQGGGRRRLRRWGIAAVVAVVGAVVFGLWRYQWATRPHERTPTAPGSTVSEQTSIAVLPFVNMSPDPDQEYFSDGLSEELINVLAGLPKLRVTSRTSSFQFKGKAEDVRTIAQRLNVAHVLEGSVRKSGTLIRITAQLVSAVDGSHEWSDTYDRDLDDVLLVQDEIASRVAGHLQVLLAGNVLPARKETRNMEAYNLVLEARYHADRRTREDLSKAVEHLEQALTLDPSYAAAWAQLARARLTQGGSGFAPIDESVADARRAAQEAIGLDPNQAMAIGVLGWIKASYDWDWEGADRDLKRALALDRGRAGLLANTGLLAHARGHAEEAIALFQESLARDPLQGTLYANLAISLLYAGRLDEAEAACRHSIELRPGATSLWHLLAKVLLMQGRVEAALEANAQEADEGWRLAGEALIHHAAGRSVASADALAALTSKFSGDMPFQIAEVHAYRGEIDDAFAWLERGRAQHDSGLTELKGDPLLRSLEADPRYRPFLRTMGMQP